MLSIRAQTAINSGRAISAGAAADRRTVARKPAERRMKPIAGIGQIGFSHDFVQQSGLDASDADRPAQMLALRARAARFRQLALQSRQVAARREVEMQLRRPVPTVGVAPGG